MPCTVCCRVVLKFGRRTWSKSEVCHPTVLQTFALSDRPPQWGIRSILCSKVDLPQPDRPMIAVTGNFEPGANTTERAPPYGPNRRSSLHRRSVRLHTGRRAQVSRHRSSPARETRVADALGGGEVACFPSVMDRRYPLAPECLPPGDLFRSLTLPLPVAWPRNVGSRAGDRRIEP